MVIKAGGESIIDLIKAVDLQLKSVHTQSLDISFNELTDMVEQGELDIRPDRCGCGRGLTQNQGIKLRTESWA